MAENTVISMEDIDRFRDYMDAIPVNPDLFLVVPEHLAIDFAKEADRLAVCQVTVDADGARRIKVLQVREGQALSWEQRQFLDILNVVKLVTQRKLPCFPTPRVIQAEHMAQLRKMTGQDWRGRRA